MKTLRMCILSLIMMVNNCSDPNRTPLGYEVEVFKKSAAWELAKAVDKQDVDEIKEICQHEPELVNAKEPYYGNTILAWAVWNDKLESVKTLLELGADPNLQDNDGDTPMTRAASKFETSEYVRLMIEAGADVNQVGTADEGSPRYPTPLMAASSHSIETTKLLVEAGADVNFRYMEVRDALFHSYLSGKIEIAHYLIFEAGADVHQTYGKRANGTITNFRDLVPDPGKKATEKEKQMLREVIDYLDEQGVHETESELKIKKRPID